MMTKAEGLKDTNHMTSKRDLIESSRFIINWASSTLSFIVASGINGTTENWLQLKKTAKVDLQMLLSYLASSFVDMSAVLRDNEHAKPNNKKWVDIH